MTTETKPILSMEVEVEFVREGAVNGRYQDIVLRSVTPGKEPKESTVRAFLGMAVTLASWKRAHITIEREAVGAPWTITKTRAFAPAAKGPATVATIPGVTPNTALAVATDVAAGVGAQAMPAPLHSTAGAESQRAGPPRTAPVPLEEASDLENAVAELQDEIEEMTDKLRRRLHELGYLIWQEDTFDDLLGRITPEKAVSVVAKEGAEDGKLRPALEKAVKALEEAVDTRKSKVAPWSKVVEEGRTALGKL